MRRRFVVPPKVGRDIAAIADYIAADDVEAADGFIDKVQDAFSQFAAIPHMGSSLRWLRLSRVPHFEKYLIVYRPHETGLEVIRVIHGARHIEPAPRKLSCAFSHILVYVMPTIAEPSSASFRRVPRFFRT